MDETGSPETAEREIANFKDIKAPVTEVPLVHTDSDEAGTATKRIEELREKLRSQPITDNGPAHQRSAKTDQPKRSLADNVHDLAAKAAWNARLTSIMIFQLGGLRPARIDGKWRWVIEPWARIEVDPYQGDIGDMEYYQDKFKQLKKEGVRIINMERIGGETPRVRPVGVSGLQLLDHRRIFSAQGARLPIVVKVVDIETV